MVGGTSLSKTFALMLVAVFAMFATVAAGLLPGWSNAPVVADPGSGWESQGPIPGLPYGLDAIDAVDNDVAWAVGPGVIVNTVNGGKDWAVQAAADGVLLEDVDAVDANTAWTVGTVSNISLVLSTADGGANWQPYDTTAFRTQIPFPYNAFLSFDQATAVTALDANTAWVAVRYFAMIPNPFDIYHPTNLPASGIWKTTDGGATWMLQYFGATPQIIYSMRALDTQTIWAGGGYPQAQALRSENGGASWAAQEIGISGAFTSFSVIDAGAAIGSTGNQIAKTFNGGQTWTFDDTNLPDATVFRMVAADANTAWAIGTSTTSISTVLAKTIDGGQTWAIQASGASNFVLGLTALDPSTAWAVGADGDVFKTVDGGDALPDIVSVFPVSGTEGSVVTVAGCDFGSTQDSSYVSFGTTQATAYTSWSDAEIMVEVPAAATGEIPVTVTTPEGTSNPKDFTAEATYLTLSSISPSSMGQNARLYANIYGTAFQPGATVRVEKGASVIPTSDVVLVSETHINCVFDIAEDQEPGAYDVVVRNPDGQEARLVGGFTVTSICGQGAITGMLMLGLTLGLLSLAGSTRMRKRRK
jgi:photosystem II stability/assembly factor-like uncharacterized protein